MYRALLCLSACSKICHGRDGGVGGWARDIRRMQVEGVDRIPSISYVTTEKLGKASGRCTTAHIIIIYVNVHWMQAERLIN